MASANIPSGIRCSKCNDIMFEYVELRCKHKLCPFCTRKGKLRDNKIVCFSQNCKKVSQKVPTFRSVIKDMRKTAIAEYKVTMKKKEEDCLQHVKLLEESEKELWEEEQKQMDLLSSMYDKRLKELKVHYRGLKRKTTGSFRKREGQIEKILTDIKNILTKIHDELKKLNDSIGKLEYEDLPSEKMQEEILNLQQKTVNVASQTIKVEIPKIDIAIQVDGEIGLNDDITIIAPEPELHVIRTSKRDGGEHDQIDDLIMDVPEPGLQVTISQNEGDKYEQTDNITMDAPEPELRKPISQGQNSDIDQILRVQWVRQEHSVKLPVGPSRLRLRRNHELWQCHKEGITVFDLDLRPLRKIDRQSDSDDMVGVMDVVDLPDGDIAVAGLVGLFLINYDGKTRRRIDGGNFTGVAEQEGALYAAEGEKGSIQVYNQADEWEMCRRIDVGCGPHLITLSIQDATIYMCLKNNAKLVAYSLSGEQMGSWGSKGSKKDGEINNPFMCITDTGGAVLIADKNNNRLQVLGADRQWSVVSLQSPVKAPVSALLHRNRLFVTSDKVGDCRLYVYEPSGNDA